MNTLQAKEVIELIQEARINEAFKKLHEYGVKNPIFSSLQQEYISGRYLFDFYDRLQAFVNLLANTQFSIVSPKIDIFFCFSSKNKEEATKIVKALRDEEIVVFFSGEDLMLETGKDYFSKIQEALESAKHFVLYYTPEAMQSEWVKEEYITFYQHTYLKDKENRRFFILEGTGFSEEIVPHLLKNIQTSTILHIIKHLNNKNHKKYTYIERKEDENIIAKNNISEVEILQRIENMNSHFVFLFGSCNSGKTSVITSILLYLYERGDYGSLHCLQKYKGDKSRDFFMELLDKINNNKFPNKSEEGNVTYITTRFTPNYNIPVIDVTFLDMSGKDIENIYIDKIPININMFFLMVQLPIMFLITVDSTDDSNKKDAVIANFFDYIEYINPKILIENKIILLLTKWDIYYENNTKNNAIEFVKRKIPRTYSKIKNNKNIVIEIYSIGKIMKVDGKDYVSMINTYYPKNIWKHIYKTFTGYDLDNPPKPKPWWKFW